MCAVMTKNAVKIEHLLRNMKQVKKDIAELD